MTDKELRKLRRVELLELLVEQAAEMEELRQKLFEAREALESRTIVLNEAGSIAEAALKLNEVFAAADQAAKDYVESIKIQQRELMEKKQEKCRIIADETCARHETLMEKTGEGGE